MSAVLAALTGSDQASAARGFEPKRLSPSLRFAINQTSSITTQAIMAMPTTTIRSLIFNPYAAMKTGIGASQINCHQPLRLPSCSRRVVTHIEDKNVTKLNTQLAGCMELIPRTKPSNKDKMVRPRRQNNIKYQNSERDARPAQVTYFEKQVFNGFGKSHDQASTYKVIFARFYSPVNGSAVVYCLCDARR